MREKLASGTNIDAVGVLIVYRDRDDLELPRSIAQEIHEACPWTISTYRPLSFSGSDIGGTCFTYVVVDAVRKDLASLILESVKISHFEGSKLYQ